MHRFAISCALVLGACSFKADYAGGTYTCSDGVCPRGLTCDHDVCVDPSIKDAGKDAPMADARLYAQTCADPQPFPAAGGSAMGTTAGKQAKVSSMCGGLVFNGSEAVYKITTSAGAHVLVSIDAGARKAYVLSACQELPQTPVCEGNAYARSGSPISLFPNAGTQYIVVDDEIANASGTYTLSVTLL